MIIDRAPRPDFEPLAGLIGRWQYVDPQGRVSFTEFREDGFYYAVQPFLPLAFGPGETTMRWGNETYTRLYGTGATVQGVWRAQDGTQSEWFFRADGTFNIGEPGEVDLFGTYRVQADQMETAEARASYAVDGTDLVFDIVFGGTVRQGFTLAGDTLTLGSAVLTRVPELIFKIFRAEEWAVLRKEGVTAGAPIDVADGYVHFSTASQAGETAAKYFADMDDLFLIAVETAPLGEALKWEASRGGALFPHLYREMRLGDVHWAQPLAIVDGVHAFPAGAGFA